MLLLAIALLTSPPGREATHARWYVSPQGSPTGSGGSSRPWDLATALAGGNGKVLPGDTIWLRGGTYQGTFTASLTGAATAPIVVRQYPGERATIDGGASPDETLTVDGQWAVYWGFEIMQSGAARWCASCIGLRPTGVYVRNASNVKLINLIVHDVGHGTYTENNAHNIEMYGWVIYNGGSENGKRSDGHGIYIKNDGEGWKVARDNVIFNQFGFGIHAYTEASSGVLKNIVLDGNILFNNGTLSSFDDNPNLQLGGEGIADNDSVTNNLLYLSSWVSWINAKIGYESLRNGSAVCKDNYIVGGTQTLDVGNWQNLVVSGNVVAGSKTLVAQHDDKARSTQHWSGNQYLFDPSARAWEYDRTTYPFHAWLGRMGGSAMNETTPAPPTTPRVFVRPNRYEKGRATIVVYNWSRQATVPVDLTGVVAVGARYAVRNVQDIFGAPIVSGTYRGGTVNLPMSGVTPPHPIGGSPKPPLKTAPAFDVFVVTRG